MASPNHSVYVLLTRHTAITGLTISAFFSFSHSSCRSLTRTGFILLLCIRSMQDDWCVEYVCNILIHAYCISLNSSHPWIVPAQVIWLELNEINPTLELSPHHARVQLSPWAWLNSQLFDCTSSAWTCSETCWNCHLRLPSCTIQLN